MNLKVVVSAALIVVGTHAQANDWPEPTPNVFFKRCAGDGLDIRLMVRYSDDYVRAGQFFDLPPQLSLPAKLLTFRGIDDVYMADAAESFVVDEATVTLIPTRQGYRIEIELFDDWRRLDEFYAFRTTCRNGL